MGFLTKLKNLFNPTIESNTPSKTPTLQSKASKAKQMNYYSTVRKPLHKLLDTISLEVNDTPNWDSFFSISKINETLPGFDKRSRKKFKHVFHNDELIIAEAAGVFEIITKETIKQFNVKDTALEKMIIVSATEKAIILHKKERIALINLSTFTAKLFEFNWQPFTFTMAKDSWLVGTRETYDGPGELYCFDLSGSQKWGISFNEQISSMFGEIKFTPYLLSVCDSTDEVFVGSMDRLYRIRPHDGSLKSRIAVSELKKKDLEKKYEKLNRSLSKKPENEEEAINQLAEGLAAQFTMGFDNVSVNSPFTGFTHDPESGFLFMMEREGRISAWDIEGNLVWINLFKNEGRFIDWVDNKLVVSFNEGETFWLNKDGKFIFGAKLPKEASTVNLIPNQDSYLIVSQDNRLYELNKETGKLIKGSEGHPGMELFILSNHPIFFDGKEKAQGYFWLSPENHEWIHFEAKTITDTHNNDVHEGVAPEITATNPFPKKWEVSNSDNGFGNRVIDIPNNRLYVAERAPRKSFEAYREITEAQQRKENSSHFLTCYDTGKKEIWRQQLYSTMWSLYLSPDGKYIFTSVPKKEEITYMPGEILVFNKEGKQVHKFKSKAQGFHLEFLSNNKAKVNFSTDRGEDPLNGYFEKDDNGKWSMFLDESGESNNDNPFGAGIDVAKTSNYNLVRTDKKKYSLSSNEKTENLNVQAAIYEAHETNQGDIALRIGTRLIRFYNPNIEKTVEIKEEENIQQFTLSNSILAVLTKKEIKGYSLTGDLLWRYSNIPKTYTNEIYWSDTKEKFLWIVSSNIETIVASITEDGTIVNSQSFDKNSYHRSMEVSPYYDCFVAQTNEKIQSFEI
ncbi:hypothetical protein [Halalkalibacter akibai]|uniref:Uncharacterized protein n=1 Tax=Halalkalibacter akibai (strain ATCC 43226 / DSM 21942 / CIP 109018 / JCM 9157 / 1139) TaxID=1236973 RepID=W4QU51_HALA3|nr:hypothetical protein [Halalkalibacter akibai]GAE35611.1 hypothetical protein JCM9157_2726 [Halalkalibacter akibai JCM 9157]